MFILTVAASQNPVCLLSYLNDLYSVYLPTVLS
jgi:hypothetical protein